MGLSPPLGVGARACEDESSPRPQGAVTAVGELTLEWRPLAALAPDREAWRQLAERAVEPNVFYDPDFALAAAPALGAGVQAALLWSRAPSRRLLGFFPIRRERRYGPFWPVATGWTHPFAPLGTPLVDCDVVDQVIDAFLTALGGSSPRMLLWRCIPEHGPFALALDRVLARRRGRSARFCAHRRAQLAPGERRADYLERAIPTKRRKELARLRRRLAGAGTLKLATTDTPAQVTSSLSEFLRLEARGWKGRAGTAIDCDPAIGRFVDAAVIALSARSMARVDCLRLGGLTLAAAITLRQRDTAWFWKIAFDEAYARSSPGVQLTLDVTAAFMADAQIARVDSCATEGHPMIDHIWRERIALCDRLIAVDPNDELKFAATCRLEALRGHTLVAARGLRGLMRRP